MSLSKSIGPNEKVTKLFIRYKTPDGNIQLCNIWSSNNSHEYISKKKWEYLISQGYFYVPKTGRTSHYAGKYNCILEFCVWDTFQRKFTERFTRRLGWSDEPRVEHFAKFFGKVVLNMNKNN